MSGLGWTRLGLALAFRAHDSVMRPREPLTRTGVLVALWLVGGWIVLVGLAVAACFVAIVAKAAPGSFPWMVGALVIVTVVGLVATVWGGVVRRRRARARELARDRELAAAWDGFSRVLETPGMVLMEVRGADQHPNGSYAIVQPVEVDGLTWTEVWFDRIPVYAPLWVAVSPVPVDKPGHWPSQWLHVDAIPAWVTHEAAAAWWRDRGRQEASARTSGRKPAPVA